MKNKQGDIITNLKVFALSIALAGSVTLPGCGKKPEYVPMNEIFYDADNTGIDDTFEDKVPDGEEEISNVIELETYLDLGRQIYDIISKLPSNFFDGGDRHNIISALSYDDIENIDINKVQSLIIEYNSITTDENGNNIRINNLSPADRERLYLITRELYENFVLINTYINNNGYSDLEAFGLNLSKAIFLDTTGYAGTTADIEVRIGQYVGSGDTENYFLYNNPEGYTDKTGIYDHDLIKLINVVLDCREESQETTDHILCLEYDRRTYDELEEYIALYKEYMYGNYEITEDIFSGYKCIKYSEGTVPTK